jgi:hypothetical protein
VVFGRLRKVWRAMAGGLVANHKNHLRLESFEDPDVESVKGEPSVSFVE